MSKSKKDIKKPDEEAEGNWHNQETDDEYSLVEAKEKNIDNDMLEKVKYELRKRDNYNLEETELRNVLMMGRTRSGKSTAVGVIKDLCHEPKEISIFSDTENPKFQSFALLNKKDGVKLTLNMIDTPGVFEVKVDEARARINETILKVISQCSQNEITKLHCVIIFSSFETGINIQDVEAIKMFSEIFEGTNIILCITRSEGKSGRFKENLKDQLTQYKELKHIAKDQIFFMGCFDSKTTQLVKKEDIIECYRDINSMRTQLLTKIFSCIEPAQIRGLSIVKNKVGQLTNLIDTYMTNLIEVMKAADKTVSGVLVKIQDLDLLQKKILECREVLDVPECKAMIDNAYKLVKEFRAVNKDNAELISKCTHIFHVTKLE